MLATQGALFRSQSIRTEFHHSQLTWIQWKTYSLHLSLFIPDPSPLPVPCVCLSVSVLSCPAISFFHYEEYNCFKFWMVSMWSFYYSALTAYRALSIRDWEKCATALRLWRAPQPQPGDGALVLISPEPDSPNMVLLGITVHVCPLGHWTIPPYHTLCL